MEAIRSRREAVALWFFGLMAVVALLMTVYQLGSGGAKGRDRHVQDQTRALQERVVQLEEKLRADPTDLRTLVALGDAYMDLGQGRQALQVFQRAEQVAPQDVHVLSDLGSLYQRFGRYDEALAKFARVLELDPNRVGALVHMGLIYRYNKGDLQTALEIFEQVLARDADPRLADMAQREIEKIRAELEGGGSSD